MYIYSTPNIGLVFRVSQVFSLVDDYTYFLYHDMDYDREFDTVINIAWNITNSKWLPQLLVKLYPAILNNSDSMFSMKSEELVPVKWASIN